MDVNPIQTRGAFENSAGRGYIYHEFKDIFEEY